MERRPDGLASETGSVRTRSGSACHPLPDLRLDRTWLYRTDVVDLEYFVVPPRPFVMQKCAAAPQSSSVRGPPSRSSPRSIRATTTPTTRTTVASPAAGRAQGPVPGPVLRPLIQNRPGRLFDVGTGDCRHFDELRRFLDLECAGIEIQPDDRGQGSGPRLRRARGTLETADLTGHIGRYDVVSMNHVLEHVVDPRTMLERARRPAAPGWIRHRSVADGLLLGEQDLRAQLGWVPLPAPPADPLEVGLAGLLEEVGFSSVPSGRHRTSRRRSLCRTRLVRRGWRPRCGTERRRSTTVLLVAALPFETVAWLCDQGGIINFRARKPRCDETSG